MFRALPSQTNLQYELQLAETECRKLRGRIITSPKKLKSNLENMANQLHSERLTLAETERRGREHQAKIDVLSNLEVVSCLSREKHPPIAVVLA